jgi:hypothetical protein
MTLITFKKPVEHEGRTYSAIDFEEPTVGAVEVYEALKAAGKTDMSAMIGMIAHDTGLPADALRKVSTSDFAKISEAMVPFQEHPIATVPLAEQQTGPDGSPSAATSRQS